MASPIRPARPDVTIPLMNDREPGSSRTRQSNGPTRRRPRDSQDQEELAFDQFLQVTAEVEGVDPAARAKVAAIIQWCFVVVFVGLLGTGLLVAPPWKYQNCDAFQTSWPVVWATLMLVHMIVLVVMSHIRWGGSRPARPWYHLQRILRALNTIWFVCGVKPLFWDVPCDEKSVSLARSFWWLQATFFLVPLCCYLLICLCLPCIVIFLNRVRTPSPNETPTPDWVFSKLDVQKYKDLINNLRMEYGGQEVEFSSSNLLSDAFTRNPIVEAIATAATGLGAVEASPTAPPQRQVATGDQAQVSLLPSHRTSGARLKLEKNCPICMTEFENSDDIIAMPCDKRHFFHVECVTQWLHKSQFCPICRANIVALTSPTAPASPTHGPSPPCDIEMNTQP